jgi:hypothetical protein
MKSPASSPGAVMISEMSLAGARVLHVDRDRPLALVETRPEQALPVLRHRPAARIEPALKPVEADHVRPHLRQRHPRQRNGHEGRAFHHAHSRQNSHQSHPASAVIPR